MKVTFCTREYDDLSGGQNTWLCHFLPDLHRRGIESRVLCFTLSHEEELPTVRSLRQAGVKCTTSSDEEKRYTEQRVRWLLEQLAENPPDVFVSNMVVPAAYYAGRWLREAGIPTVGICHVGADHFLYPGLLDEFVLGRAAYQVSAFVCVSKYLEQAVLNRRPEGILVRRIPCGVPIPKDVAKKPNGRLRLAYVGRLAEEAKRISEVTHALCRAVREVPGTEALIYGDGPDRRVVEQILREEGDGLRVHLVGRVENDDVSKYLLKCHAGVLLSDWEGLGLALLEEMACGLATIGLRHAHGGASELIEDGVTGLLVDDRGDGFVAAVRRLREDPALWERLARSARAQVEAEYGEERCAARWQELLRELVNDCASRKRLRIPLRLDLPPVHPALAVLDERVIRPHQRLIRRARRFVSRVMTQSGRKVGS
ncbi:MAG: glycosyl transferase family 1 [Verrucomicrobia bacterium]|nr:MAG: glycosyl transferase family 1 [Verrucomicrobiota bacterium]